MKKTRSAPAAGLQDAQAYKASVNMPPCYSMRPKVSFGSQFKNAKQADEGGMAGDLSAKTDQIRTRAPAWTMNCRESGITKTKDSPGPGQYAVPSTLYGAHPQLPVAGRVPRTTVKRSVPQDCLGAQMKINPSPQDYDTMKSHGKEHKFGHAGQPTSPSFTMRPKVSFGSQFKNAKQADEGGMAGDISSKIDQVRPAAPKWSFIPRESGIVKTKDQPGPGEYVNPSTLYGAHPQLKVSGRVPRQTAERFPAMKERPY
eukprot:TRINITY_DN10998_c1_g1_i1.p1 TRINITY_DN10998_c1_g1~~TRINITY_DN10998_c1_g1_i1.p1  ORF type:complete len:257 (+),score=34.16 TRINITY_DN10998_c1_g1_i1:46-816(+)